ncbi:MAG TPA: alcohol dehydrogenase catalytic domain-containing protein [candidate division Zixibacteria bacterium]|nr:alcohol dehydrogenase catalytic domain-containing protein [candidate division Zixibacteria bacterium]
MLAVRTVAAGEPLRHEDLPVPRPGGTEVRVRVAGCGVCHTDLHLARSDRLRVTRPVTLGHEIGGWLDAAGPEAVPHLRRLRLADGDPVLVFGGWGCGRCRECAMDQEQRCPNGESPGFQRDGGYAEHVLIPHPRHLVPLRDLDPADAAPLADAGVTPYRAVARAGAWLTPGARVLLIGFGGLGQFAIQFLRRHRDLTVAVREIDPDKLTLAAEAGADLGVLEGDESLLSLGLGGPADVVFDFVGTDETLAYAARNVAPGGLLSLVGEAGGRLPFGFDVLPVEAWLTTTAWGSLDDLREVVRLARRGRLRWQVEKMPLREAQAAHDRLAAGRVSGRLVLVP